MTREFFKGNKSLKKSKTEAIYVKIRPAILLVRDRPSPELLDQGWDSTGSDKPVAPTVNWERTGLLQLSGGPTPVLY